MFIKGKLDGDPERISSSMSIFYKHRIIEEVEGRESLVIVNSQQKLTPEVVERGINIRVGKVYNGVPQFWEVLPQMRDPYADEQPTA